MTHHTTGSGEPDNILIIETDELAGERHLEQLRRACSGIGGARTAVGIEAGLGICEIDRFDIIVISFAREETDHVRHIRTVAVRQSHAALIVLADRTSLSSALDMMRAGASDILVKPVSLSHLRSSLHRFAELGVSTSPTEPEDPEEVMGPAKMIGSCDAMQALYRRIEQAAPSNATVFLQGESGTGKEHCAHAVHELSKRAAGPLISLNCSAIPRELMESEMFGHERGAFTGAHETRKGAAERAHGGTLFLDEICEMDLALQAKLLRFIQTGEFTRVGGSEVRKVDVRFICATNKDPMTSVQRGEFRADLYYRLHVLPVELPPLRQRGVDILDIAKQALKAFAQEEDKVFRAFECEVEDALLSYHWPGNVRELMNVVRNIVVMNDGEVVSMGMLPPQLMQSLQQHGDYGMIVPHSADIEAGAGAASDVLRPLWQQEQEIIERAIALCSGNIGAAASHLGISPSTIYRKRNAWSQEGAA